MKTFCFCVSIFLTAASLSTLAADKNGLFMVKGGGSVSCAQFLEAQGKNNNELISLAGWLDGYLTHINQTQTHTFDMVPWQDTNLLLAAIGSWCKKNPQKTFHQAVFQMVTTLNPGRLLEKSEFAEAQSNGQQVVLYREIIQRVQKQLKTRGHYAGEPNGNFDEATLMALKDFQKSKNLPETGLPDQVTLANLL